jgi:hypothetical protein
VAVFDQPEAAVALQARIPAPVMAGALGNIVLLWTPGGHALEGTWSERARAHRGTVASLEAATRAASGRLVDVGALSRSMLRVTCVMRDEASAQALEGDLADYRHASPIGIRPPWIPQPRLSADEWARQRVARRTYRLLLDAAEPAGKDVEARESSWWRDVWTGWTHPEQFARQAEEHARARARAMQAAADVERTKGVVDDDVLRLLIASESRETWATASADLRVKLGADPAAAPGRTSYEGQLVASLKREGSRVDIAVSAMRPNVAATLPPLASWLCAQGCGDLTLSTTVLHEPPELAEEE